MYTYTHTPPSNCLTWTAGSPKGNAHHHAAGVGVESISAPRANSGKRPSCDETAVTARDRKKRKRHLTGRKRLTGVENGRGTAVGPTKGHVARLAWRSFPRQSAPHPRHAPLYPDLPSQPLFSFAATGSFIPCSPMKSVPPISRHSHARRRPLRREPHRRKEGWPEPPG